MPVLAVASQAAPVPLLFPYTAAFRSPVAPPSVAPVVPDSVTVALSLSVTLTVPEPAVLTLALLARPTSRPVNDSGPSTRRSSGPVTVRGTAAPRGAREANDWVPEL